MLTRWPYYFDSVQEVSYYLKDRGLLAMLHLRDARRVLDAWQLVKVVIGESTEGCPGLVRYSGWKVLVGFSDHQLLLIFPQGPSSLIFYI